MLLKNHPFNTKWQWRAVVGVVLRQLRSYMLKKFPLLFVLSSNFWDSFSFWGSIHISLFLFGLCQVFVAVHGLSLIAASGEYSLVVVPGLLLLRSTGSRVCWLW